MFRNMPHNYHNHSRMQFGSSLEFTDFENQHQFVDSQYQQPIQNSEYFVGCPRDTNTDSNRESASCYPQFYCPGVKNVCPPGYVHAGGDECYSFQQKK